MKRRKLQCTCGSSLSVIESSMTDYIDYVIITRIRRCKSCQKRYKSEEKIYNATISEDYTHNSRR